MSHMRTSKKQPNTVLLFTNYHHDAHGLTPPHTIFHKRSHTLLPCQGQPGQHRAISAHAVPSFMCYHDHLYGTVKSSHTLLPHKASQHAPRLHPTPRVDEIRAIMPRTRRRCVALSAPLRWCTHSTLVLQ
jgi:hypothetical protein